MSIFVCCNWVPTTLNGVMLMRRLGSQDTHHTRWYDEPSPTPLPLALASSVPVHVIMRGKSRLPPYPAGTRCPSPSSQGQHQRRCRIQTGILPVLSGKEGVQLCPGCPMRPQEEQSEAFLTPPSWMLTVKS